MKAIQLPAYGADQLRYEDVPTPQAGPGELLVRVRATGINHLDTAIGAGYMQQAFPVPLPWIPGLEYAGTIEAVGAGGAGSYAVGQEVYGVCFPGGANAEYVVVKPDMLALKPQRLSFTEAASVPVSALTAWQSLVEHGHLQAGQTVLVHGGAGGVGSFAVQLAHQQGANVIATASAHDLDFVKSLGADQVIDYHTARFEEDLAGQVDLVLDTVGGDTQQRSYQVLKPGGYLVSTIQPPKPEEAAGHPVHASMMQMHPGSESLAQFTQLFDAGTLQTEVGRTYPLAQTAAAWADVSRQPGAAPKVRGKIVVEVE